VVTIHTPEAPDHTGRKGWGRGMRTKKYKKMKRKKKGRSRKEEEEKQVKGWKVKWWSYKYTTAARFVST